MHLVMGALIFMFDVDIPKGATAIRNVPSLRAAFASSGRTFQDLGPLVLGNNASHIAQQPTLSRCQTRKNLLPSAECFYGRLKTMQGEGPRWQQSVLSAWITSDLLPL